MNLLMIPKTKYHERGESDVTIIFLLLFVSLVFYLGVMTVDKTKYTVDVKGEQGFVVKEVETKPQVIITQENERQMDILAATMIGEAGGEKEEDAMLAVLCVIRNRADTNKGWKLIEECLKPKQFSMWNESHDIKEKWRNHPKWDKAHNLAYLLLCSPQNFPADPTGGATHYHVYQGKSKVSPYWTHPDLGGKNDDAVITAYIGNHVFLKDVN